MSEKRRKIMLGFRSQLDAALMREWALGQGYDVAASFEDTADIDLVFMDSASARHLKDKAFRLKREAKYFLPVLVGIATGEDVASWIESGFDDVVHMPATKAEWKARVDIMLRLRHQSEELADKSESLHRALIESSGDHIFVLDATGTYVSSNDRVGHFGLGDGEGLVGKTLEQVYPREVAVVYRRQLQRVLAEGKSVVFECELSLGGRKHYLFDTLYLVKLPDSSVMVGGVCRDITEWKLAEKKLWKSQESLQYTLENMTDGFVSLDENWNYTYVNKKAAEMLGREPESLVGKYIWTEFPEGLRQPFYKKYCEAVEMQKQIHFEDYYQPWGRWFENRVSPSGNGLAIFFQDITERKQAEETLLKQEHFISAIIDTSPALVYVFDLETQCNVFINTGIERLLNYSKQDIQVMGDELFELLIHPDDMATVISFQQQILAASDEDVLEIEYRIRHADGSWRTLHSYERPFLRNADGLVKQKVGVALDITEKKHVEQERDEARQLFQKMFELSPVAASLSRVSDRTLVDINKANERLLGYTREELLGVYSPTVDYWVDPAERQQVFETLVAKGRVTNYEFTFQNRAGEIGRAVIFAEIFKQRDEQYVLSQMVDITMRQRAEEELRVLKTAIDNALECILVSDQENRLTYVNQAFENLSGYSAAEALGKTPGFLKSHKHDNAFYQNLKATIYSGNPWQGNIILRRKDGDCCDVSATITPILDNNGLPKHFVSVHRDITKEREQEQRIQQNQRLEAIGTLAGGIAHDFNNLLSPIIGFTELCMDALPVGSKVREDLEEVMQASRRATDLVRQILSFSRKSNYERKPLAIGPIVKEALKLLRASIPVTIDIHQDIHATEEMVVAAPTEIHQVVMNLCTNGFHAMPDGGDLRVSLKVIEMDSEASVLIPDCSPGRYLNLSVEDTGHGIAPEIRDNIFEPYFTTKKEGRGTGLGLAVTHSIVASCGGAINVYSELGKGTRFSLYFPVADAIPIKPEERSAAIRGGDERILFVDDDTSILRLAKDSLERYGYTVTAITNPVEALTMFEKAPSEFDMVITDMTMPEMTGDLFAAALLKKRPDLPVIICTGFSERMNKEKAKSLGVRRLLEKPVSPNALLSIIREIFHGV